MHRRSPAANRLRLRFTCMVLFLLAIRAGAAPPADRAGLEFFEARIRPVLVQHCYPCHSAEARANKKLRGGLLLDTRQGLLTGGDSGPAVIPGKPDASPLLQTMRYDGDVRMPPKQKLPAPVLADFERWVRLGAPDPRTGESGGKVQGLSLDEGRRFWAYRPIAAAPVPPVKARERLTNDSDAFVVAKLEAAGLALAPEADRATLIRRLSFDLLGLPPPPEAVDAFIADRRPDAYERLVEAYLASPHFGERWGRHWLDVARFGESLTLRGFVLKEAWRYRDYVLDTFNDDVPFDRFVREQIAGDLFPAATVAQRRRQLIATTFLTLGNTNLEEQDKKQLRMDVVDEQLDAIGRGLLGQTLGCARCHDHKFDPIPTRDYYALAGILRNTRTMTHANVSQWIEVPLPEEPEREKVLSAHERAVAQLQQDIKTLKSALVRQKPAANPSRPVVRAVADLPGIVVDDEKARKVGAWTASKHSRSFVGAGYVHDGNSGKGEKTITFQPEIRRTGRYEVLLAYSAGTNRAARVPVTVFSADGEKTLHVDQRQPPEQDGLFHSLGVFRFESSGQGYALIATGGTDGHVVADAVAFVPVHGVGKSASRVDLSKEISDVVDDGASRLRELEARLKQFTESGPRRDKVMAAVEEPTIEDARVHVRGSPHILGDRVPRGFLQVATAGSPPPFPTGESGRRQLADWLASADNPLTARVFVNRVWHWLFGAGLVATVDNFGTTGESPSHPELLDLLSRRFVADGWSVKRLVRQIVLSRTYRQAAHRDPRAVAADPENRFLAGVNRRRLDAEGIRDTMLSVSGQLTLDRGGPTFPATLAADYAYKHTDTRRSVYAPVFRNTLPELFEAFDFADPSVSTGRRTVSTVVPQALYLMNHPFVLIHARHAARRLLAEGPADADARLIRACRWTLGRLPTDGERRAFAAYLAGAAAPEDAWTRVFQVLFASVDFRYVY